MLKIIMGCEVAEQYLPEGMKFELMTHLVFNNEVRGNWLEDSFCQEIIKDIDHSKVLAGTAIESLQTGEAYSAVDLSGGTKFLINVYKNTKPNRVFMAYMGDNCTDFLERIALKYEQEGKDLWIVADYMYMFKFRHIKEIYYVNWNIVCHSELEISDIIYDKYIEQQSKLYNLGKYRKEDNEEEDE